jgi:hypothetical protein
MRHFLFAALLFFGSLASAQNSLIDSSSDPIATFMANSIGQWNGSGKVVIQNLPNAGTYPITVQRNVVSTAPMAWDITTTMSGMPHSPSTTVTGFDLGEDGTLQVASAQYTVTAYVKGSTSTTLAFSTEHVDPISGATVKIVQSLLENTDGSFEVVSDIYQRGNLVEHFTYSLTPAPTLDF